MLFLPKVFNESGNYLKLNTTFWVVSVKYKLGGNKKLSVPESFTGKFVFHLWSFFSNWDSFVQMLNAISE